MYDVLEVLCEQKDLFLQGKAEVFSDVTEIGRTTITEDTERFNADFHRLFHRSLTFTSLEERGNLGALSLTFLPPTNKK